jgi:hypothetical protein
MKYVEEHSFFCGMPKQRRNAASLFLVHEMLGLYKQPASVGYRHYESFDLHVWFYIKFSNTFEQFRTQDERVN